METSSKWNQGSSDTSVLLHKGRRSPLDMPTCDEWREVNQIVVTKEYQMEVLHLAHEAPMAGHLGFIKTYQKSYDIFTGLAWRMMHNYIADPAMHAESLENLIRRFQQPL